jgi:hypothetical protein
VDVVADQPLPGPHLGGEELPTGKRVMLVVETKAIPEIIERCLKLGLDFSFSLPRSDGYDAQV